MCTALRAQLAAGSGATTVSAVLAQRGLQRHTKAARVQAPSPTPLTVCVCVPHCAHSWPRTCSTASRTRWLHALLPMPPKTPHRLRPLRWALRWPQRPGVPPPTSRALCSACSKSSRWAQRTRMCVCTQVCVCVYTSVCVCVYTCVCVHALIGGGLHVRYHGQALCRELKLYADRYTPLALLMMLTVTHAHDADRCMLTVTHAHDADHYTPLALLMLLLQNSGAAVPLPPLQLPASKASHKQQQQQQRRRQPPGGKKQKQPAGKLSHVVQRIRHPLSRSCHPWSCFVSLGLWLLLLIVASPYKSMPHHTSAWVEWDQPMLDVSQQSAACTRAHPRVLTHASKLSRPADLYNLTYAWHTHH